MSVLKVLLRIFKYGVFSVSFALLIFVTYAFLYRAVAIAALSNADF